MTDQLLRAKGSGTDRLTNPVAYEFRRKYGRSYYQFKPDYAHYWILLIFGKTWNVCSTAPLYFYRQCLHVYFSPKTRHRVCRCDLQPQCRLPGSHRCST